MPSKKKSRKPKPVKASPVIKSTGRPVAASKYLAELLDQFFLFIEQHSDRDAQAQKLLELETMWKEWLGRKHRFFDGIKYEQDFMDRIGYYLADRVALVKKLQERAAETEGGPFIGF